MDQQCCSEGQCCNDPRLDFMFSLAERAKIELIKEKLKAKIEAEEGKKLDLAVNLVIEVMRDHKKSDSARQYLDDEIAQKFSKIWEE